MQHDFNIANQGFPATRADINNAFQAIASNSSGPTAPSTTYANMWWYDETNNKMYLRNEADSAWIEVATIDQTNNEWQITTGVVKAKDSDGLALKTDDGTTRLFIKDSDGAVGIGTASPSSTLDVEATTTAAVLTIDKTTTDTSSVGTAMQINTRTSGTAAAGLGSKINFVTENSNGTIYETAYISAFTSDSASAQKDGVLSFSTADGLTNPTERMRIDSSGNLLVGTTSTNPTTGTSEGIVLGAGGIMLASNTSDAAIALNRTTSNGDIAVFKSNGSEAGNVEIYGTTIGFTMYPVGNVGMRGATASIIPFANGSDRDNVLDLGRSTVRWDDIYATNGTIQTSDQNEKQQIASLTDAEITAAKAISKLFKTFKWNDSVAEKGDAARTHSGVIAQDVEQAMTDAGLNAGDYAFFISTTWWETQTEVPAVEAVEAVEATYDEDGNVLTEAVEAVEAQEAYTQTDTYKTAEEAPEGATERNRKGIRYPQLLSFIGAATEQRLASIESRLDALEA